MKTRNAEELLKKIQKGATAGFSVQDWLFCLDTLGNWLWTKNTVDREARYTITAPNGDVFKLEKKPGYRVITFYEFEPWARAHGLMDAVEAKIGPAPRKKTRQETEANAGTCPCCFGGFKLKDVAGNPGMVFHGFKRPGYGYTIGECYGVNHLPYELSCSGTRAFVAVVEHHLEGAKAHLAHIKVADELVVTNYKGEARVVKKGEAVNFEGTRHDQIREQERRIAGIRVDIEFLRSKIANWTPQPLPSTVQS